MPKYIYSRIPVKKNISSNLQFSSFVNSQSLMCWLGSLCYSPDISLYKDDILSTFHNLSSLLYLHYLCLETMLYFFFELAFFLYNLFLVVRWQRFSNCFSDMYVLRTYSAAQIYPNYAYAYYTRVFCVYADVNTRTCSRIYAHICAYIRAYMALCYAIPQVSLFEVLFVKQRTRKG